MKLDNILKGVIIKKAYLYNPDIDVFGISDNSCYRASYNMFVCIKGDKFDAHNIMHKLEKFVDVFVVEKINPKIRKCQILVDNCRKILLKIYINFNNTNISKIKIIGVTGTNGKTTTTYYTKFLLEKLGKKVALIGTSGCMIDSQYVSSNLTTPTQKELANLLATMVKQGVEYLVIEVSAHAVKQYRVSGLDFDVGAFTNLTMDHLDDFSSMYEYAYYKFSFLSNCKKRILNIDDKFADQYANNSDIVISSKKRSNFNYSLTGGEYHLNFNNHNYVLKSNIQTTYNAYNLTLALAIIYSLGLNILNCFDYLADMPKVDGRYNLLKFGEITICIDYAHSPDAIEKVLSHLRKNCSDLIVIFGASGFRDSLKRNKMGKIASKYADYIILTADNPRFENVMQINAQISTLITKPYVCIENRYKAIEYAYSICKKDSTIAILGKGNETTQDICAFDFEYNDEKSVYRIFNKEHK